MCVMSVMLKMSMSVYAFVGKNVFVYDGAHVCFVVFFSFIEPMGYKPINIYIYMSEGKTHSRVQHERNETIVRITCARIHAHMRTLLILILWYFLLLFCARGSFAEHRYSRPYIYTKVAVGAKRNWNQSIRGRWGANVERR